MEQELLLEMCHSSVINMYGSPEIDTDGNLQYMAFEPCVTGDILTDEADGMGGGDLRPRTLEQVIVRENLRGIDAVRPIMLQMAEGGAYLHGHSEIAVRGLSHRDLKPANVLVKRITLGRRGGGGGGWGNQAKLTDFGSSKIHAKSTMAMTKGVGTEGWQSPEGIRREPTSAAADVFSMGLLFVYCLTGGRHAFGDVPLKQSKAMNRFAFADDEDDDDDDEAERAESVATADRKLARSVVTLVTEASGEWDGEGVRGDSGGEERQLLELAASLACRMLRLQPSKRPSMAEVVGDPFFTGTRDGGGDEGGESKGDSRDAVGVAGEEEVGECVVCMDGENTHIFFPCGHKCVCEGCAAMIMGDSAECPTCRGKASQTLRIYS